MATRQKRTWHSKFREYMLSIVQHPNYRGMPFLYKNDGEIRWIASGKSDIGKARFKWWDEKRKKLNIPKEGAWISKVARAIHPTGEKPCQICGKVMSLDYVYPNNRGGMSPGAMSNAPDRLDGYHTYNRCCRAEHDTGRHVSNLSRYGEDRRAYENWADGDWKAASWLMKEFNKHGLSADHVGPISLGFSHRPSFRPTTRAINAARNNRMNYIDVQDLLSQEVMGEVVISSHSKYLWDKLKTEVKNDSDALRLSKLMRQHMHVVLSLFAYLAENGHSDFLIKYFLHPEYAQFSIRFESFDPKTGLYAKIVKTKGNKKQYDNNAKRYIRISLDSLQRYVQKENRHAKSWKNVTIERELKGLLDILSRGYGRTAYLRALRILRMLSITRAQSF